MIWFLLEEIVKSTESFYAILPSWLDENSVKKKRKTSESVPVKRQIVLNVWAKSVNDRSFTELEEEPLRSLLTTKNRAGLTMLGPA